MADLCTTYIGLTLRNPIIVSSCGLTGTAKGIRQCVEAGAGAVVVKSLFEEQIDLEVSSQQEHSDLSAHPEASEYIQQMGKHLGPSEYLKLIETAKRENQVPIIASVNCVSSEWWVDWARQLEKAGADALELNIAIMPRNPGQSCDEIEKRYVRIVEGVSKRIQIPIAVKIGPYATSLPALAHALTRAGAAALVLFNRFYQLDVDIDRLTPTAGYQFSTPNEIYQPLRWISVLSTTLDCQLSGSTGVHSGKEAVKLLLAGAHTVQLCSTLYCNGLERLAEVRDELNSWMETHGFVSLADFRGHLAQLARKDPETFERLQYIKALTGVG